MEVNLNKSGSAEALIQVKLKKEDYQPNIDKKVRDYAKKASIKGFRQGKVPPGMIKKMYGKSILVEEINEILSKTLTEYLRENNIKILGEPLPDEESMKNINWDSQEEFEFGYRIGIQSDFTYDISKSQKLKKYTIEVDKKIIKDTLEDISNRYGTDEVVEISAKGDIMKVSIKSEDGTIVNEEARLKLDDVHKKEEKKFVGLKKGDSITFDIRKTFEDEYVINSLTGNANGANEKVEGTYELTVLEILRRKPAEMGQELYDAVFGPGAVKDEKEFKEKITETIQQNYDRESDHFLDHTIRKHLLEKTAIDLPDNFLKEWLLRTREDNTSEEDIEKEYKSYAESLKWNLIQNKIVLEKEIKVDNEEIIQVARAQIIEQFGGPQIVDVLKEKFDEFVGNYLQHQNGKNYSDIHFQVVSRKVFETIKGEITISDKKVSLDEFTKLVNK